MALGHDLFLILSNLAFLFPACLAYRMHLVYECTIYTLMCVVSGFYHIEDTTQSVRWLHYRTAQTLDFYMAFSMITRTALMVIYNTSRTATDVYTQQRNTHVKLVAQAVMDLVALILVLEDVKTPVVVMSLSIGVLFMLAICAMRWRDNFVDIDLYDLFTGAIVLVIASVCYFVVPDNYYWAVHSIWHIGAAIGCAFMIEALNQNWCFILWVGYFIQCCFRVCYHVGHRLRKRQDTVRTIKKEPSV